MLFKHFNGCDSCDPKCVSKNCLYPKGNLKGSVPWWAPLGYQQFNGNIGTIQPTNRPSAYRASMGVAFLPYAGRCPVPSKYVTRFGLRSPPHMAGTPTIQVRRAACLLSLGHFPRFLFKKDELVDLSCANSQRMFVSKNKLMSDGIWRLTYGPVTCRTLLCKEFCIDESN